MQADRGIRGLVKDEEGKPIKGARISIANRRKDVFSYKDGDYWRLLVPGSYEVSVAAKGYEPETKTATVSPNKATELDFVMRKIRPRKARHLEDNEDPRGSIPLRRSLRDYYRESEAKETEDGGSDYTPKKDPDALE